MKINFVEKYNKYKDDATATGRLLFAYLFNFKGSPYYDPTKYDELIKKLAETEPLGNYFIFIDHLIKKNYVEAFEHFKLFDPYLFGHGEKYPQNRELAEWVLLKDWDIYRSVKLEIRYFERKMGDFYGECDECEKKYGLCFHYRLNQYDVTVLNILRYSGKKFECPICYEDKLFMVDCGGLCFERHGSVCFSCVKNYEQNNFKNYHMCQNCRNRWCKNCSSHIATCPFCRVKL